MSNALLESPETPTVVRTGGRGTRTPAPRPKGFWQSGDVGIWLSAGATAVALLLILGVFVVVAAGGLGFFWPRALSQYALADGSVLLGLPWAKEPIPAGAPGSPHGTRIEIHAANRDLDSGREFFWVPESDVRTVTRPADAFVIERLEYGEYFGFITSYRDGDELVEDDAEAIRRFEAIRGRVAGLAREVSKLRADVSRHPDPATEALLTARESRLAQYELGLRTVDGRESTLPIADVVRAFRPNRLSLPQKVGVYASRVAEFVSGAPREANTKGGVFPAIFGTVLMVFLMTLVAIPLGVTAALYLREYAKQGALVRAVRIAVNNLAGVPSIVFGIFGLGFFVYFVGGAIDRTFFADQLPSPTFGTGGILWSAMTLALLTLPVVIVATEEGLAAVPRATREGSLALGATKWETIWRVVLPAASPGILTGVILAMARAAGEVAPLMLTGAVKIAAEMPVSSEFPFLHAERKFMHLGFHIYDVGFQSPNVEAAKPMVYMTTFLLVVIVVLLNVLAMWIRQRLRARLRSSAF